MGMLRELDERLQYGPGMRVQRFVEAAFLVAAIFVGDTRFAYLTLGSSILQAISGRLVPFAWAVAAFVPPPHEGRGSGIYFDLDATRGASAIASCVLGMGIWLVGRGYPTAGFMLVALPTASLMIAPALGFCCGCAIYIGLRDVLVRLGLSKRYAHGACDIDIDGEKTARH
jgi:Domain of unknown function (DUF4395)